MRLPNLEIHMYPDNDKYGSMNRMKSIMNKIPDPCIPVYLHYNKYPDEKDFGVPSNKIYESIAHSNKLLINTDKNQTAFGVSSIKSIRIYNRPFI